MRVVGIMSGTSLDGIDYVICSFDSRGAIAFEEHWQVPFPRPLRHRLLAAASNEASAYELSQLHHDLGRLYAKGARSAKVDLAGLHGQTVFHRPDRSAAATLQIGEPAYLAQALNVPVVSNFRAGDLAAGGQGAPLAPMFHQWVFARRGLHVAVNNLGGISNVTSLDSRLRKESRVMAFDTGPANILIDLAVQEITNGRNPYDRDGKLGRKGEIEHDAVEKWLRHPFFRQSPPKSTGRELFGRAFLERCARGVRPANLVATLTDFTARSIVLNYRLHLGSMPDRVVLCGGGRRNSFLLERFEDALRDLRADTELLGSDQLGWDSQVIEGAAFALLAWLRWNERPGNIPEATGAKRPCLLGQLSLP